MKDRFRNCFLGAWEGPPLQVSYTLSIYHVGTWNLRDGYS